MSGLLKYSTPAERLRGLSLSEIGGTFTGSNNIEYELNGNEFNSNDISIVCKINPSFNYDEGVSRVMFDCSAGNRYALVRIPDNRLAVYLGNTANAITAEASSYSSYWEVGSENIIIITARSTENKLYFAGNLIKESTTAWSPKRPSILYAGSYYIGTGNFYGDITEIRTYKRILTPQEISDIQNNSTYNYKNKYRIHYPMTQATHSGSQTLDVSGNNLHGTLVGAPTKLTGQGYNLDGSTQYITFPEQTFPGEFTLGIFSNPEMETLDGFFGHTTDTNKMILYVSGKVFVRVISTSDSTVDSNGAVVDFLGLTRDSDNKVDLYINQNRYRLFGDVAQVGDSVWDYIGRTESGAQNFAGDIFETIIDNKCLTPTQMHDLSLRRFALDI
jgi:hypothetical protein